MQAVAVFSASSTQWRRAFSGVRTGLDYPGVESVMRQYGVESDSETFSKIQTLEQALIEVDREKHAKQNGRSQS